MTRVSALLIPAALVLAAPATAAAPDDWYAKAVQGVTAAVEPAEAKPGQTVTVRVTVDLADGYHTYPTAQPEKTAAGMVNKLLFPTAGPLVFVGPTADPTDAVVKAEPELGIKALRTHVGRVTYARKAVVSPTAAAGPASATVGVRLNVCDANNCFPPKTAEVAAKLAVLPGPAVDIDPAFRDEVGKAGK